MSISFVLKIVDNVEMIVQFPHEYPAKKCAEIFVKSNKLSRDNKNKLNKDILYFLHEVFEADYAITTDAISWLQEHICEYKKITEEFRPDEMKLSGGPVKFGRLWLYSHHIYSKTKRKHLLDLAKENKLTGFCMPGKPGIVCLEGILDICNDVWSIIKQWNWKQIDLKYQEDQECLSYETLDTFIKFDNFEEIGFVDHNFTNGHTIDYYMDISEFLKYLKLHNCEYIFKELYEKENS